MKHTETEMRSYTKTIRVLCDKCGAEIQKPEQYARREFDLRFVEGTAYPEAGSGSGWQIEDLCDGCVSELRKLLEREMWPIKPYKYDW